MHRKDYFVTITQSNSYLMYSVCRFSPLISLQIYTRACI